MKLCALLVLCILPCSLANEVENLAPSQTEELGATAKTGGYFSALQTSGSFTMMQAGGFEELGEAPTQEDIKARAQGEVNEIEREIASLQAKLQDKKKMMLGGAQHSSSTSSSHRRRAGFDGAAACKPDGTLDCDTAMTAGDSPSACKDSDLPNTLRVFIQGGSKNKKEKRGTCLLLNQNNYGLSRQTLSTNSWSGKMNGKNIETVLTKPFVAPPHKAGSDVGVFGFKRVVCTSTTNSATKIKTSSCANFKTAYCVHCAPSGATRRRGWPAAGWGPNKRRVMTSERVNTFLKNCVKGDDPAFNTDGNLKDSFRCSARDQEMADYFIMTV